VRENADLKDQLARERVKANLYDHLSGIRTQPLEATSTPGLRAVVLATPPFSPYDSLVLSLGGLDGVQPGDVVLYSDAVALGTVSAVAPHAATVTLYSTSGHEESVRIGENGFLTVARGLGGGMFQMSVPKETPLLQGDGVFLPDGMMLGSVRTITESDSDAFSTVTARLPVNLFELRTVYVVPSLSTPL
jgi:cell shape-determining protein MreC